MMRNFPVPYPNELLYSTVARAGVYQGILSPKQLLTAVFNNSKVLATLDLPCHLEAISEQLRGTGGFSIEDLIYRHTMFPVYAPFVIEAHRVRAIQLMTGYSKGALHLLLGVTASRIPVSDQLRYCPECLKKQHQQYGQGFWQRNWFLPGLLLCPEHGLLSILPFFASEPRHQFHELNTLSAVRTEYSKANPALMSLAQLANKLLSLEPCASPTFAQWTIFYNALANDLGFCRGKHIKHAETYERVNNVFNQSALAQLQLQLYVEKDTCWLKSIFRKHRKAFSYLAHGIVWQTLLPHRHPAEILDEVRHISASNSGYYCNKKPPLVDVSDLKNKRLQWQKLVELNGVLAARKSRVGGALYAWLYRHDQAWFLAFNHDHKLLRRNLLQRADWHQRDLAALRQLRRVFRSIEIINTGPRLSANYLLSKLTNKSIIKENLEKLPLVTMFLQRYSESITDYQLRRVSNACIELLRSHGMLRKWLVLRQAGLSEQRLTHETHRVMFELHLL